MSTLHQACKQLRLDRPTLTQVLKQMATRTRRKCGRTTDTAHPMARSTSRMNCQHPAPINISPLPLLLISHHPPTRRPQSRLGKASRPQWQAKSGKVAAVEAAAVVAVERGETPRSEVKISDRLRRSSMPTEICRRAFHSHSDTARPRWKEKRT